MTEHHGIASRMQTNCCSAGQTCSVLAVGGCAAGAEGVAAAAGVRAAEGAAGLGFGCSITAGLADAGRAKAGMAASSFVLVMLTGSWSSDRVAVPPDT